MEEKISKKGKQSHTLLWEFAVLFVLFLVVTVAITMAVTYLNQSDAYYRECASDLKRINRFLAHEIEEDGEDFAYLIDYFKEHQKELKIPFHYPDTSADYKRAFMKAFSEKYPGKIFNQDISFPELDDETKLLFARYEYIYWLNVFDAARDSYGLDYVYFVYPTEGEKDTMCYMFDGFKEEVVIDGESCLVVGFNAYQDPKIHASMWKAWETGQDQERMDILNNEFGHVYSHSTPVKYQDRMLGLITTEMGVSFVVKLVQKSVLRLGVIMAVVMGICLLMLLAFVQGFVLKRIFRLESCVRRYAQEKDPAIAETIRSRARIPDEVSSLASEFSGMIIELQEYMENLKTVTAERERIGAELDVATQIQASMLPCIFPPFPNRHEFDLFASMDPAKEVGGDFYDFFFVDEDHLALVMADVSGKGVPASLFMAISKALIKDRAIEGGLTSDILTNVNNTLCDENGADLFVTVWLGILEISTGLITYTDAGHENPVLVKADGTTELVLPARKKPPVATIEGISYTTNTVQMEAGDLLFLYTDGVPEATNAEDELYGMDRLLAELQKDHSSDATTLLKQVREDVDRFVKDAPQFDDLTMLAIRLNTLGKAIDEQ